jgi:hypothetical protein
MYGWDELMEHPWNIHGMTRRRRNYLHRTETVMYTMIEGGSEREKGTHKMPIGSWNNSSAFWTKPKSTKKKARECDRYIGGENV